MHNDNSSGGRRLRGIRSEIRTRPDVDCALGPAKYLSDSISSKDTFDAQPIRKRSPRRTSPSRLDGPGPDSTAGNGPPSGAAAVPGLDASVK